MSSTVRNTAVTRANVTSFSLPLARIAFMRARVCVSVWVNLLSYGTNNARLVCIYSTQMSDVAVVVFFFLCSIFKGGVLCNSVGCVCLDWGWPRGGYRQPQNIPFLTAKCLHTTHSHLTMLQFLPFCNALNDSKVSCCWYYGEWKDIWRVGNSIKITANWANALSLSPSTAFASVYPTLALSHLVLLQLPLPLLLFLPLLLLSTSGVTDFAAARQRQSATVAFLYMYVCMCIVCTSVWMYACLHVNVSACGQRSQQRMQSE